MSLPAPFAYPTATHVRRHGPKGYSEYQKYKPFLRDEFVFRCVYCLERERWYPNREGSFSADHFVPKAIEPGRETDYDNLVYACVRCNSFKQATIIMLDPAKVAFADHFSVKEDGHIEGLTPEAQDLIDLLHLDADPALEVRKEVLAVLRLKRAYPDNPDVAALFATKFGYPTDLPDLKGPKPPLGNTRPEGVNSSHRARKDANTLPDWY